MGRWDLMVFSGSSKWILDYADGWVWGLFLRQWAEVQIQLSDGGKGEIEVRRSGGRGCVEVD